MVLLVWGRIHYGDSEETSERGKNAPSDIGQTDIDLNLALALHLAVLDRI